MSDGNKVVLDFDIRDQSRAPLREKLLLDKDGNIATFESQFRNGYAADSVKRDYEFLMKMVFDDCAYGAMDCPVMRFMCQPADASHRSLPTAREVLKDLKTKKFRSCYESELGKICPPYRKGRPFEYNDLVHTDEKHQHMFSSEDEIVKDAKDEEDIRYNLSIQEELATHRAVREYCLGKHLYYVVLHAHGDGMVVLFAVWVSPHSGNLVGAISYNLCHNLCD